MTKRVYLSGPITKGNRTANFSQAAEAQKLLMAAGFAVLNPMLSMMHPDGGVISWEQWIASDLPWVEASDLVVRLPGESKGGDMEVQHANKHGISVVPAEKMACLAPMFAPPRVNVELLVTVER